MSRREGEARMVGMRLVERVMKGKLEAEEKALGV